MSGKYRKVTLTLVVRSTATDQVRSELEEAAGLIAVDNFVYEHWIDDKPSKKPAVASDYEMDENSDKEQEQQMQASR